MQLSDLLDLRLPRLRYDRIFWVLFLLITGLVLVVALRGKKESLADSTAIDIAPLDGGVKLIAESNVRQLLLRAFGNTLEGTEMERLEVERIEKVLEEDPFVLNADAYVDQRNVLHVRIEQRNPVLRVLDTEGGNYYLDKEGKKMPPSQHFAAHVLVATGHIKPFSPDFQERRRNNLKDVFGLAQFILADAFLAGFIQQIHVNSNGEIMMIPLIGDQKIILGSTRRLEDKVERLKLFYKQAMPYEGWRKYKTINLKYNGQIVCKK